MSFIHARYLKGIADDQLANGLDARMALAPKACTGFHIVAVVVSPAGAVTRPVASSGRSPICGGVGERDGGARPDRVGAFVRERTWR
ncbi:hypothetical protein GCM10010389_27170 [Streptomyces echinoruber]|uniref:Uncharacterized protein n=1 Tax=Streptomyces echinoruber TaxID=68898 RepID=A0A918VAV3_9ACTN|nr:hypothetical protein GCM10010389_27170 [Streptomyces echinoruber]